MRMEFILPVMLLFVLAAGCIGGGPQVAAPEPEKKTNETVPVTETVKEVPKVVILEYPSEINSGEGAYFRWSVTGAKGSVPYTAVYVGKSSVSVVGATISPSDTAYTIQSQNYPAGSYAVPGEFRAYVKIDEPGTYYARAHTLVSGKNVWSDEVSFVVMGQSGQPVKEFTVRVSDAGFEPVEIKAKKGDLVIINFVVSDTGTHPNGVRILSPSWSALALMPGDAHRVEFTADSSFEYRLFWMAGNLLKSTGKVTVE